MGYRPCPKCGTPKQHKAALCRSCRTAQSTQDRLAQHANPNPTGMCHCGCGELTPISKTTSPKTGTVKGYPTRYINGHHQRKSPREYTIDPVTGCWNWERAITRAGYGHFSRGGVVILAHRHFYEMANGAIPAGLFIDHLCRNRRCVNPEHLEAIPHAENCRRGRGTKLTTEDIATIRALAGGLSQTQIAQRFGVRQGHISRIINGTRWK